MYSPKLCTDVKRSTKKSLRDITDVFAFIHTYSLTVHTIKQTPTGCTVKGARSGKQSVIHQKAMAIVICIYLHKCLVPPSARYTNSYGKIYRVATVRVQS